MRGPLNRGAPKNPGQARRGWGAAAPSVAPLALRLCSDPAVPDVHVGPYHLLQVVPGWELGIVGAGKDMPPMNYGGVRKVIIPSKLAYGAEGYACKYDASKRGNMNCLVSPYDEIEMVIKVLLE